MDKTKGEGGGGGGRFYFKFTLKSCYLKKPCTKNNQNPAEVRVGGDSRFFFFFKEGWEQDLP